MSTETFHDLLNHIFTDVYNSYDSDLVFVRQDGKVFRFTHFQDCCESVSIEDIYGDLKDLVGSPLLIAEECDGEIPVEKDTGMSSTWTFYKFSTINGSVTVRWCGESNGYYSESVSFEECDRPQDWIRN